MKKRFESGVSKRGRKQEQLSEAAAKNSKPITSFLKPLENIPYPTNNATDNEISATGTGDISMPIPEHEDSSQEGYVLTVTDAREDPVYVQETQQQQGDVDLTQQEQFMSTIGLTVTDTGIVEKSNAAQMQSFLQISCFEIPSNIPRYADNHTFPTSLLTKSLPNSETCTRDWLCWNTEKQSLYCASLFILNKMQQMHQFSLINQDGASTAVGGS
ncbi:uncharacterized protein LOC127050088 [Gopherus flavomarginatus]|uniref:uncharacterized protein LOC127050088 n=1 Tax=Gopherus flavomarginatus TaxID=286002 RepID=UPI0021CBE5AB|nr:uncharacterized protein LOC127050088 [Gopherus flavomarginatus]